MGFLRFLGFWLGDGHLNTEAGYSSVGITQRKLESTAWLIDLLDDVFPRWWRRCFSEGSSSTYHYAINCPPLVEWLRVMASGPAGYNPLDPAQLRKYPHFDRVAWVEEQENASPYRSPRMAGTSWTEATMLSAFGLSAVRRPCCVCGDAGGVRLSCGGTACAAVDAITRAHPACVDRGDGEALDAPWYCPECSGEKGHLSIAAALASTEDDTGPSPAKRRRVPQRSLTAVGLTSSTRRRAVSSAESEIDSDFNSDDMESSSEEEEEVMPSPSTVTRYGRQSTAPTRTGVCVGDTKEEEEASDHKDVDGSLISPSPVRSELADDLSSQAQLHVRAVC